MSQLRHEMETEGFEAAGGKGETDSVPGLSAAGPAGPSLTAKCAHLVDMAKKNPALFIPVKVGEANRRDLWQTTKRRAQCLRKPEKPKMKRSDA